MYIAVVWLILLLPCGLLSLDTTTLRFVQILHRHGERSPTGTYPLDPYQESFWPDGFGQLTKEGKLEMYKLGKFIKQRYVDTGYLSEDYVQTEIKVLSSDKDRTLMSASLVLAGLYTPKGRQLLPNNIPWQPIPVHTIPLSEDFLLSSQCALYVPLLEEMFLSERVMKIQEKHRELINYAAKHSGVRPDLNDLLSLIDPVYCETHINLTLPDWLQQDKTAEKILALSNLKAALRFSEPQLARLKGGPLLGRMLQNMRDVLYQDDNFPRKAFFYSGHDTTINALLRTLEMFNELKIPTASSVYVELHVIDNKPVVQMLYRNETADPYLLHFTGCETPCPLEKLTSLTKHMIPDDPVAACKVKVKHRNGVSATTVAVTVLTLVILAVICVLVLVNTLRVRRRLALYRYSPVNQHM